jgi:hypothetical protein
MASISIKKPGSASAATPTHVAAGISSPEKNSRNAAPDCLRLVGLVGDDVDPQRHDVCQSASGRLDNVAQVEESLPRLGSQV